MTVKINMKVWERIRRNIREIDKKDVRVGIFDGRNARIGRIHEYGAPGAGIPERSYMRGALKQHAADVAQMQAQMGTLVLGGRITVDTALRRIGAFVRDLFKQRIIDQPPTWPARSKEYDKRQRARGKTKTLIDTGQLIASIIFKVVPRR